MHASGAGAAARFSIELVIASGKAHEHKVEGAERETLRLASAGQPSLGTELRIARSDGTQASAGEIGEILINSPSSMLGYWNNHAATAEALCGN